MAYKIVVGYDGTDGGKAALDEAVDLARQRLRRAAGHVRVRRPQAVLRARP